MQLAKVFENVSGLEYDFHYNIEGIRSRPSPVVISVFLKYMALSTLRLDTYLHVYVVWLGSESSKNSKLRIGKSDLRFANSNSGIVKNIYDS